MGKEFENEVKNNKHYAEIANQEAQVASLMNGRTEVIVIDENIFKYYYKLHIRKKGVYHDLQK